MSIPTTLSVLIFQDGDDFVAQCVEHDIASQGVSPSEALYDFERVLIGHILLAVEDRTGFENIPPAPSEFREWYNEARPADWSIPTFTLPDSLPIGYAMPVQNVRAR